MLNSFTSMHLKEFHHLKNVKISTFYFAKKFIRNTQETTWREKILNLAHK